MTLDLFVLYTNWEHPIVPIMMILGTLAGLFFCYKSIDSVIKGNIPGMMLVQTTFLVLVFVMLVPSIIKQVYELNQYTAALELMYSMIILLGINIFGMPGVISMIQEQRKERTYKK